MVLEIALCYCLLCVESPLLSKFELLILKRRWVYYEHDLNRLLKSIVHMSTDHYYCRASSAMKVKGICRVSLVPRLSRSLSLELRGGVRRGAWYTLFAHALIILVITRVCVILENIRRYPSWLCTKYWNTQNVLENLRICRACCSAHYCKRLFIWSIISNTSGNIINTMVQSVAHTRWNCGRRGAKREPGTHCLHMH